MKNPERKLSRRTFLAAVGAGGASATVAMVSKDKRQATADPAKSESAKGYRVTEHIQNYYRTAKV